MMKTLRIVSTFALASFFLAGCLSPRAAPPRSGEGVDSKSRQEAFEASAKNLAKKIGAPVSDVAGVSQEDVTWPDSCLGCAATGESCAQVLTPGYKIVVRVRDATYTYHTNRGDQVRLCDQASLPAAPARTPGY